jgi:hypothetical protein
MKFRFHPGLVSAVIALLLWCGRINAADAGGSVVVVDNGDTYTLSNGVLSATISKRHGGLTSLVYQGIETMASHGGAERAGGNWSHAPSIRRRTAGSGGKSRSRGFQEVSPVGAGRAGRRSRILRSATRWGGVTAGYTRIARSRIRRAIPPPPSAKRGFM